MKGVQSSFVVEGNKFVLPEENSAEEVVTYELEVLGRTLGILEVEEIDTDVLLVTMLIEGDGNANNLLPNRLSDKLNMISDNRIKNILLTFAILDDPRNKRVLSLLKERGYSFEEYNINEIGCMRVTFPDEESVFGFAGTRDDF